MKELILFFAIFPFLSFACAKEKISSLQKITKETTVEEILSDSDMKEFSRLLFPVHRNVNPKMTLFEISTPSVFVWYSNIKAEKTVEIVSQLKERAKGGEKVFFNIYSEKERKADGTKNDAGLFFFKGEEKKPFAIFCAGGGFVYVGAMHDSFPHALEISKKGLNAFALIYRPNFAYEDLARAIEFIFENADSLGVDKKNYSLWGGSAGARMAAELGNEKTFLSLVKNRDIPKAKAVVMQYTGYEKASAFDAPTFSVCGTLDAIAPWRTMQARSEKLKALGVKSVFYKYEGLSHGFGLGTGTVASGWLDLAVDFWLGM